MAGLIAMASVFFVVVIEMVFSSMNGGIHVGCHSGGYDSVSEATASAPAPHRHRRVHSSASIATFLGRTNVGSGVLGRPPMHRRSRSGSMGRQLQRLEFDAQAEMEMQGLMRESGSEETARCAIEDDDDLGAESSTLSGSEDDDDADEGTTMKPIARPRRQSYEREGMMHGGIVRRLTEDQQQKKNLLQVMLLEAGILFHSVFIGEFAVPLHGALERWALWQWDFTNHGFCVKVWR